MNVEGFSSAWRGNLSCEECAARLNVFRKKKVCFFCKNSFCQVCIMRKEDKKLCCRKCQILTARPLDRSKLLNLKSRDLINYLTSKQIPTNGCVEKEDLVNVLIRAVNESCFHPCSTSYYNNSITSIYPNISRNNINSPSLLEQFNENTNNNQAGQNLTENDVVDVPSSQQTETEEQPNFSTTQRNRLSNTQQSNESFTGISQSTSNFNPNQDANSKNCESLRLNKPLMLSDIKHRSDLDALSIKQLKELLMRNRTDFKGCVERSELIQKADRLWRDYTVSRKDLENLSLEELCKICMDAPIECVLLECGHMATCTSCGKQLCECPICRQFVVRCVRTFKA